MNWKGKRSARNGASFLDELDVFSYVSRAKLKGYFSTAFC